MTLLNDCKNDLDNIIKYYEDNKEEIIDEFYTAGIINKESEQPTFCIKYQGSW